MSQWDNDNTRYNNYSTRPSPAIVTVWYPIKKTIFLVWYVCSILVSKLYASTSAFPSLDMYTSLPSPICCPVR